MIRDTRIDRSKQRNQDLGQLAFELKGHQITDIKVSPFVRVAFESYASCVNRWVSLDGIVSLSKEQVAGLANSLDKSSMWDREDGNGIRGLRQERRTSLKARPSCQNRKELEARFLVDGLYTLGGVLRL